MKILLFASSLSLGGADKQVLGIAGMLVSRGYDVTVLSLTPIGHMGKAGRDSGLEVLSLDLKRKSFSISAPLRLYRLLNVYRPDVLITFMYHANVLGKIVAPLSRTGRIVISIRNENFGSRFRELIEKYTQFLADSITTNSANAAMSLLRRGIVKPGRIEVIPNGIDHTHYGRNQMTTETKILKDALCANGHFLWIAVGRLHPQKDYPTMIRAFARLGPSRGKLIIVGQYLDLKDEIESLISECNVGADICLLGQRYDVPAIMALADGYIFSSAWEGLPNTVMEAMASELPVVSTDVGGVSELVKHGVTGFISEPGDPDGLAQCMEKLLAMSAIDRKIMGAAARNFIVDNYSWDAVIDKWDELVSRWRS